MKSQTKPKPLFFSFGHEDGIEFHDTAVEARDRALAELRCDEALAEEGWHEEVEYICWGEVRQSVMEVARRKADPESGYDEYIEYALLTVDREEDRNPVESHSMSSRECPAGPLLFLPCSETPHWVRVDDFEVRTYADVEYRQTVAEMQLRVWEEMGRPVCASVRPATPEQKE